MWQPRIYRDQQNQDRWHSFTVTHQETDMWIGVDHAGFHPSLKSFCHQHIGRLRDKLDNYIRQHPHFEKSLTPLGLSSPAPLEIRQMNSAAQKAMVGPMSTVAGLFAQTVGQTILRQSKVSEVVIENGGDLFLAIKKKLILSIYAGNSPLSHKIGVVIPPEYTPLGVCTSSGTVGPSRSFGRADAVMIACRDTPLADAYATALGNQVKKSADIERVLAKIKRIPEILSAVIIFKERLGVTGHFELCR